MSDFKNMMLLFYFYDAPARQGALGALMDVAEPAIRDDSGQAAPSSIVFGETPWLPCLMFNPSADQTGQEIPPGHPGGDAIRA